jgi:transposase
VASSKETLNIAIGLRQRGLTDVEVARRLGVTRETVRRWLGPRTPRGEKTAALEEGVRRLRGGERIGVVATQLGVSTGALRQRARSAGASATSPPVTPEAALDAARGLRRLGLSDRQIARQLAIPRRRLARDLGFRGREGFVHDRRLARIATCLTLYQTGLTQREVAQALGVSRATVHRALGFARRQGIDVPRRQKVMLPQYRRLWSSHDLLGKAVEWHEVYDRPPTSSEWNPWHPHHSKNLALGVDRIERFYAGEWPFTSSVIGPRYRRPWKTSWNRFLETAGFTPLPHNYHYVTDDYGKAIRIDGKRLIHSNDHKREYLEGDRLGRRPRR